MQINLSLFSAATIINWLLASKTLLACYVAPTQHFFTHRQPCDQYLKTHTGEKAKHTNARQPNTSSHTDALTERRWAYWLATHSNVLWHIWGKKDTTIKLWGAEVKGRRELHFCYLWWISLSNFEWSWNMYHLHTLVHRTAVWAEVNWVRLEEFKDIGCEALM